METDAKYIHGMLNNPNSGPNVTINRWIEKILMFYFTLRHVAVNGLFNHNKDLVDNQGGYKSRSLFTSCQAIEQENKLIFKLRLQVYDKPFILLVCLLCRSKDKLNTTAA